jgi:hypothetical protein
MDISLSLVTAVTGLALCASASAQLYRCESRSGVTVQSAPCASGDKSSEVEGTRAQAIRDARQRELADAEAERLRRIQESTQALLARRQAAQEAALRCAREGSQGNRTLFIKLFETCARMYGAGPLQDGAVTGRRAPIASNGLPPAPQFIAAPQVPQVPPPPSIITSCDPAGCFDNQGHRYINTGGPVMPRSDGATCINVGGHLECH